MLLDWINDVSSSPRKGKRWPIIDADEQTLRDYTDLFRVARDWGYNGITIWGLYVDHAWPVDLESCITPQRRRIIDAILEEGRRQGIAVYSGLGVYTWGFEEIIRAHPEVARNEGRWCWGRFVESNGVAMCYHQPAAREWMRRIIDFAVKKIGVAGLGFQSADQGRCYCSQCKQLGHMQYHALVNAEAAAYVRRHHPHVKLSVSGWGMNFNEEADFPYLKEMAQHLDFITDVSDQAADKGGDFRRKLVQYLPCAFGSLGGAVVVPPQRWERDRWFLPHAQLTGSNIRHLALDGGRAFEFFAGPMNNPQYDIMTRCVGRLLTHPDDAVERALGLAVEDVLVPETSAVRDSLVQWLLDVERAYFSHIAPVRGQLDFEPLVGDHAGPPVYLDRLGDKLAAFAVEMTRLQQQFQLLSRQCRQKEKASLIDRCLTNIQKDVAWRVANSKT